MREMQENYYLLLFMFASQLYFYVLGPSNLLDYQYFNLGSKVIFVISNQGFLANQNQGLAIFYKQPIVLLEELVDILMNENNGRLVFLWFGSNSKSTIGANSQWFPRLVMTPSKVQVLTPRSYLLFSRYFNFVLVVLCQFWYQSKHRSF